MITERIDPNDCKLLEVIAMLSFYDAARNTATIVSLYELEGETWFR